MEVYLNLINSVIHVVESLMSQEELPDALAEEKDDLIEIYKKMIPYEVNYDSVYLPKVKSKVIKIINYYSVKFQDDFSNLIEPFFKLVNQQVILGKFRAVKANDRLIQNLVNYYK